MGNSKVIYGGRTLIDLTNDDVKADKLLKGIKAHDSNGDNIVGTCEYDVKSEGLTISSKEGTFKIPPGYHDGSGEVGLDETEKQKLIAENIREGITVLGVEGTMSGNEDSKPQSREVAAPLNEDLTVLPEEGYNCLSQVVVKKGPYQEIDNTADGKGITVMIG